MSSAVASSNVPPSCHGGLENLDDEHDYWIEEVEGTVPPALEGTFYRNGPGRQRIGTERYGHWFDGDGMLCAFRFDQGRVHFRNRYVRTPKYEDETRAGAIRYRGFGTQIPGGLRKNLLKAPANPANTHSVCHAGRLLALYEGGRPWALDPQDLSTQGEWDFDGALAAGEVMSAHGRAHPFSGDYISFGAGMEGWGLRGPRPCLNLYRVNHAGTLYRRGRVSLDTMPFCHDFAITEHYALFFLGSIVFGNPIPILLGARTFSDLVRYDSAVPMQVLVVDLKDFSVARQFETSPGTIIHFGNAYEDGDEIVVDGMFADDFDANETLKDVFNPDGRFNGGQYHRYRLNLRSGQLQQESVTDTESEFPTYNPRYTGRRNEVTYTAASVANGANSFFNALQRIPREGAEQLLTLPPGTYGSEPVFAATADARHEEDGYLLSVVYNAFTHRSELHILRAENIEDRVAVLRLPHHIPHQFHGQYQARGAATP
ncbi:MAG: carotenoid oxygenase family protein [Pseudomonadota bacterium]